MITLNQVIYEQDNIFCKFVELYNQDTTDKIKLVTLIGETIQKKKVVHLINMIVGKSFTNENEYYNLIEKLNVYIDKMKQEIKELNASEEKMNMLNFYIDSLIKYKQSIIDKLMDDPLMDANKVYNDILKSQNQLN